MISVYLYDTGAKTGHFSVVRVTGGQPCYKCRSALALKQKKKRQSLDDSNAFDDEQAAGEEYDAEFDSDDGSDAPNKETVAVETDDKDKGELQSWPTYPGQEIGLISIG